MIANAIRNVNVSGSHNVRIDYTPTMKLKQTISRCLGDFRSTSRPANGCCPTITADVKLPLILWPVSPPSWRKTETSTQNEM